MDQYIHDDEVNTVVGSALGQGAQLLALLARKTSIAFEVKYFLLFEKGLQVYTLLTQNQFPSLTHNYPAVKWFEREIHDLYGIIPTGHPDLRPLMLYPENWPPVLHPLAEDIITKADIKSYGSYPYKTVHGTGVYEVMVGPIHAGGIEPGHFRFSQRGEPILLLEIRHFWKHRGIEKLMEGKTPTEALTIVPRISGDNAFNNTLAYLQAIESGFGVLPDEPVLITRRILAELERIWNHVRDLGWLMMDIAFTKPAQQLFALQETLLRLNWQLTEHRFMFDALTIDGVRRILSIADREPIQLCLKLVEGQMEILRNILRRSSAVQDRFEETGRIFPSTAKDLSLTGICAKGSGLQRDTRVDCPYLGYNHYNIPLRFQLTGDVMARFRVRVDEIGDSIALIRNFLSECPKRFVESSTHPSLGKPMATNAVGMTESSRGNVFCYVELDDQGIIRRFKYVDPSFRNWSAIQYAVQGDIIADFPVVNKSMNLSYAGNDG